MVSFIYSPLVGLPLREVSVLKVHRPNSRSRRELQQCIQTRNYAKKEKQRWSTINRIRIRHRIRAEVGQNRSDIGVRQLSRARRNRRERESQRGYRISAIWGLL